MAESRLSYTAKRKELLQCDCKGVADLGRLTEKLTNKFQNLYGIALEQNCKLGSPSTKQ